MKNLLETESDSMNSTAAFYMSFGDLMVILCCFFVLIHSVSKIEIGSFERIRTEFTGTSAGSLVELAKNLETIAADIKDIQVSYDTDGVRINMETTSLFEVSSAVVKKEALKPLDPVLIQVKDTSYSLDIEGHTDDQGLYRVRNKLLETNWSLSGLRASSVLHHLLELGFEEHRMRIVGYASVRPKVDFENKEGEDLIEARAANRRVSILIH